MSAPGRDLVLRPGPGIAAGLVIPASELVERFSRSSGPGGQSVNTTDSRVELEYDVAGSAVLTETQRARVMRRLVPRLAAGRLVVVASEQRSQLRNRVEARERLAELLRDAMAPPPPARRPTRPSRASQRRRVESKRRHGATQALRGRVRGD